MGTHRECGSDIRWVKRPDDMDKYMAPLEYVGHAFIIIDAGNGEQSATEMATYRPHHCDPEKMLAWQEYLVKVAAVKAKATKIPNEVLKDPKIWKAARNRNQETARVESMVIPCPTCNAVIGVPCLNISIFKKTGEVVPTVMPHPKRWTPSKQVVHDVTT